MSQEITIAGIHIAPDVLEAIVSRAVEQVEGVASVGSKGLASSLVQMFSSRSLAGAAPGVEAAVEDEALVLTVHLAVFFGYPFKDLAAEVRAAAVAAVDAQVGVACARVDVCIDSLVFPKE